MISLSGYNDVVPNDAIPWIKKKLERKKKKTKETPNESCPEMQFLIFGFPKAPRVLDMNRVIWVRDGGMVDSLWS